MVSISNLIQSSLTRKLGGWTLAAALCVGPAPAFADRDEKASPSEMIVDVAVARPVGFAMTVLGAAAFVVSLPFSALGGNVKDAADNLVIEPGRNTFVRCLGCISAND